MEFALFVSLSVIFVVYLLYTRQIRWLLGVVRNMIVGVAGILGLNLLLASSGLAVGVNIMTAFVVGILGIPGLMMLYAARMMVG